MKQRRRILVTGGAGYIGSVTAHRLAERGDEVWILDNLSTGRKEFVPRGAKFIRGDLADPGAITAALRRSRAHAVLHFAASALVGESVQEPLAYYDNNVRSAIHLLAAMQKARVRLLVASSTCAIFGAPRRIPIREDDPKSPVNPYGRSKLMVETMLEDESRAAGLRYMALRYFNAAGAHPSAAFGEWHEPETHLVPNLLRSLTGGPPVTICGDDYPTPDGTCVRDYVHVDDLASAHLAALDRLLGGAASSVVNLGTGRGRSVLEILHAVERVTGRKVPTRRGPRRPGDPPRLVASAARARRLLGWSPRHDLDAIIASAWEWELERARRTRRGADGQRAATTRGLKRGLKRR